LQNNFPRRTASEPHGFSVVFALNWNILLKVMARNSSGRTDTEQFLLRAIIISLLIHLTIYGTWRVGKNEGWWKNMSLPAWMRLTPNLLTPMKPKPMALVPSLQPQPSQLVFVDVDPALAEAKPPKAPKFYSANNSTAGNAHPKQAKTVEIQGRQDKVIKTTADSKLKPQPLRPSPPKPDPAETPAAKPLPLKAYTPGDFVMAKPAPKPQEKESQSTTEESGTEPTPEPKPEPVHHRPRTIAEAMAERGMAGAKSRQDGGVPQLKMDSSLDAMRTSYGDYDREFIDAVRSRWFQLLENRTVDRSGKVVVQFRMLPDGRITNLQTTENDMTELLGIICQRAIFDPAPYRPWPLDMRRDIPNDFRDVTFTFYYSTE
jgi:hypothetical protein